MLEIEFNSKLKCLLSYNRGQYIDEEFNQYCVDNRIKIRKT